MRCGYCNDMGHCITAIDGQDVGPICLWCVAADQRFDNQLRNVPTRPVRRSSPPEGNDPHGTYTGEDVDSGEEPYGGGEGNYGIWP